AARFVSGYLFVPNVAAGRAVGGGATHAWMQVYLPGAGRVDCDPTNSMIGNRNLIRVAVAWDPTLVLPLWGTFMGSAASGPRHGRHRHCHRRACGRRMKTCIAIEQPHELSTDAAQGFDEWGTPL